jgi:molybdopterin molybdotransferase
MKDLRVEDARALMLRDLPPVQVETVALTVAMGRVLAEDVVAGRDQPPFDASAMDGWALAGPGVSFRIVGESAAGHGYRRRLQPGEAVRIFTGAPVPAGADRVALQEDCRRNGDHVETPPASDAPTHIRPSGGDFRAGDRLLSAGMRLDPWRLGLAAAAGRANLAVARRPQVAVLSTGEEIVPVGVDPGPDQIFNSSGPSMASLITAWGGEPISVGQAGDSEDAIADAVGACGGDVVVTLGGASVGDHDLVKPALMRLGLDLRFVTIKLRPGKPTWFGTLADGRRVVGLPGNPASGLVCAELFLRPLLNALMGAKPGPSLQTARLAAPMPANGPREHWARGRLSTSQGTLLAEALGDQDSSLVSVFANADALIRRPAGAPGAAVGDVVEILRLERL